ncbi:MAG: LacI family DNA-binding transcriptional regulator [Sphaerochaetaceae bacterium]
MTIMDVAKAAGVSKSTVSLVLNNSPLVKEKTREHVLDTIHKIGFTLNSNARGLINHKYYNLGVLILIEDEPYNTYEFNYQTGLFSSNISNGILEGLDGTEYGLITERFCAKDGNAIPRLLQKSCIDGLFVIGDLGKERIFEYVKAAHLPFVAIGRKADGYDSVFTLPGEGAYLATKHLIDKGHRKLCYLNAPQTYISSPVREAGARKAMEEAGLDMTKQLFINTEHNTGLSGYEALENLDCRLLGFDGIVAVNDIVTMGILRFCYERNIKVPKQLSVVSGEDSILCGYASPALSAVNINKEQLGFHAAKLMLSKILGEVSDIRQIHIPLYLVERDSVAPVC